MIKIIGEREEGFAVAATHTKPMTIRKFKVIEGEDGLELVKG